MFDLQELIALLIVLACALNLMRVFLHSFSGKQSHCGGCSGCGSGNKKQDIVQIAPLSQNKEQRSRN